MAFLLVKAILKKGGQLSILEAIINEAITFMFFYLAFILIVPVFAKGPEIKNIKERQINHGFK